MNISLTSALVSCLLFAAACRTSAPEATPEPGAMAAASTDPCCTVLAAAKGTNSVLTNTLAKCIMFGATVASCNWPQPKPPTPDAGTGGNVATGGQGPIAGSAATGGRAGTGGSGGPQTPEEKACANLNRLGCPEGADVGKCAGDMMHRCINPKVKCNTDCLISATSKATVTSSCKLPCGSVQ